MSDEPKPELDPAFVKAKEQWNDGAGKPRKMLYRTESMLIYASEKDDAVRQVKSMTLEQLQNMLLGGMKRIPKTGHASRAERLSQAHDLVEEAMSEVEDLKGEVEEWKENLPENLQDGDKASQLEEAISNLEQLHSDLEGVDFDSVEFPGMF